MWMIWQCTTINAGYAVGDRVIQYPSTTGSTCSFTMQSDATNVYLYLPGASGTPIFINKGSNAQSTITLADWEVFVYAEP
jgi:hypothetical protein